MPAETGPRSYVGAHRARSNANPNTPTLRGAPLREWVSDTVAVLRRTFDPTPTPPTVEATTDIPNGQEQ